MSKDKAKFISEEITYKNGHMYIVREVKEGKEARKEMEKRLDEFFKPFDEFFREIHDKSKR